MVDRTLHHLCGIDSKIGGGGGGGCGIFNANKKLDIPTLNYFSPPPPPKFQKYVNYTRLATLP